MFLAIPDKSMKILELMEVQTNFVFCRLRPLSPPYPLSELGEGGELRHVDVRPPACLAVADQGEGEGQQGQQDGPQLRHGGLPVLQGAHVVRQEDEGLQQQLWGVLSEAVCRDFQLTVLQT